MGEHECIIGTPERIAQFLQVMPPGTTLECACGAELRRGTPSPITVSEPVQRGCIVFVPSILQFGGDWDFAAQVAQACGHTEFVIVVGPSPQDAVQVYPPQPEPADNAGA